MWQILGVAVCKSREGIVVRPPTINMDDTEVESWNSYLSFEVTLVMLFS